LTCRVWGRKRTAEAGQELQTHLLGVANNHVRVAVDPFLGHFGVLGGVGEDGEDVYRGKRESANVREQLGETYTCPGAPGGRLRST
jgi:hypothetical protein